MSKLEAALAIHLSLRELFPWLIESEIIREDWSERLLTLYEAVEEGETEGRGSFPPPGNGFFLALEKERDEALADAKRRGQGGGLFSSIQDPRAAKLDKLVKEAQKNSLDVADNAATVTTVVDFTLYDALEAMFMHVL